MKRFINENGMDSKEVSMRKKKVIGGIIVGITGIVGAVSLIKLRQFCGNSIEQDNNRKARLNLYYTVLSQWLNNNLDGKRITEYLMKEDMKVIAIYGAGKLGELLYKELAGSDITVKYFIDKDASSLCYGLDEICVKTIDELHDVKEIDAIIVTPVFAYDEIEKNIHHMFSGMKVISLEDVVFDI